MLTFSIIGVVAVAALASFGLLCVVAAVARWTGE